MVFIGSLYLNNEMTARTLLTNCMYTKQELEHTYRVIDVEISKRVNDVVTALKMMFLHNEDADNIVDFLYDNDMAFLLDPLGFGVPTQSQIPPRPKRRKVAKFSDLTIPELEEIFVGESSGVIVEEESGHEQVENVVMHNEERVTLLSLAPSINDYTYGVNDHDDDTITNWLSRPRVIATIPWILNGGFNTTLEPYHSFFTQALHGPLLRKIDNYFLFRGKLRLQFKINGSNFHYGRVRACFMPGTGDVSYPQNLSALTIGTIKNYNNGGSVFDQPVKTSLSQRPGIFLDPTTNAPQEMILPFMFYNNYIDLRFENQLKDLGLLTVYTVNRLRHSNNGTAGVDIKIFASIIDPVLSTPMEAEAFQGESEFVGESDSVASQSRGGKMFNSKKEKTSTPSNRLSNQKGDEFGNGIISAPASALASFAGMLGQVPVIGKFALATKLAANAVSDVAKLWGFSRPTHLEPTNCIRPRPVGKIAVIDGEDTIPNLALDSKQEITIDPSTVGLDGVDQMAISYVIQRESLLHQFDWTVANDSGVRLASIKVHPRICPIVDVTDSETEITKNVLFPTALAWGTMPFHAWRGSIIYRIQIVASNMHRGRLLVQWDPNPATYADQPNTSTRYSQILDLTECRDMSFCVTYNQPEPFRETRLDESDVAMISSDAHGGAMNTKNADVINGVLHFFVFNKLAAPITTSTISVNVYVRAGDDFILNNPNNDMLEAYSYHELIEFTGESQFVGESMADDSGADFIACEENLPYQEEVVIINGSGEMLPDCDDVHKVFYGEQITSFRALLRRYTICSAIGYVAAGTNVDQTAASMSVPYIPGGPGVPYGNSGRVSTAIYNSGNVVYNLNPMSLVRFIMQPYAAFRGSMRFKHLFMGDLNNRVGMLFACRQPVYDPIMNVAGSQNLWYTNQSTGDLNLEINQSGTLKISTVNGAEITNIAVNGRVIEFELPWQASSRFQFNNIEPVAKTTENAGKFPIANMHHEVTAIAAGNITSNSFVSLIAAGTDFSCFYFINAPMMYGSMRHDVTPI